MLCRAADNLASVALISAWLASKQTDLEFTVVFTKCEEQGRSGAKVIAERLSGKYKGGVFSIDVLQKMPGVGLGSGLVIKRGDASFRFSEKLTDFLVTLSRNLKYTEINMSRGNNEASIFAQLGYTAGSVGFAIENYHNLSPFGIKSRPEEFFIPDCFELIDFLNCLEIHLKNFKS
jgi:putative aminopeptidase FrvX